MPSGPPNEGARRRISAHFKLRAFGVPVESKPEAPKGRARVRRAVEDIAERRRLRDAIDWLD